MNDAKSNRDNDDDRERDGDGVHTSGGEPAGYEQELAKLRDERDQFEQQLQRAMADTANIRRRQRQEMDDSRRRVLEGMTQELLPVLDSFDLALSAYDRGARDRGAQDAADRGSGDRGPATGDSGTGEPGAVKGLVDGVRMVRSLLAGVLERHGLREIEAAGAFDPARHEAVAVEPAVDRSEGQIVRVLQTGYQLGDHVVRHSKVVVAGPNPKDPRAPQDPERDVPKES